MKRFNNISLHDSLRLKSLFFVCQEYQDRKPDSAIYFAGKLLEFAQKGKNEKYVATAKFLTAWSYCRKGENEKAFPILSEAIKIQEKQNDLPALAASYNAMGAIFSMQKDSAKSVQYHLKALKIFEKVGDKKGMAIIYSNLSNAEPNEVTKEYVAKSLQLFREIGDKQGIATALYKMAQYKLSKSKSKLIPEEYFQCLKTFEDMHNLVWASYMYSSISALYFERAEFKKAYEFAMKGYVMASQHDLSKEKMDNLRILVETAGAMGKHEEALRYYQRLINERDSVQNINTNNSILKQEMEANYEKEKAVAKKEEEKKIALEHEKASRQKLLSYGIGIVLLLVVIFSVVITGRLRLTNKQKKIIEEQNLNTERQKEIIETKQKEIIDSINYAKRLQEAILPKEEYVKIHFPESFVIFKPKDIVAGDFYWLESVSPLHLGADLIFMAAADCTGHGVPGAIVSMICHNALNRALLEYEITDPGKLLTIARELIISTFEKGDGNVKDGMDISLCCINSKTKQMEWAGANNPLWIITANSNAITELKPTKQPVGKIDDPVPFKTTKMQLQKGDQVYLFTDGFADQFGGPKGKKFKYKQLEELLLTNHTLNMSEQSQKLTVAFDEWKGNLAQVDDVCLIGIKI